MRVIAIGAVAGIALSLLLVLIITEHFDLQLADW